jgi:hypothetical protein
MELLAFHLHQLGAAEAEVVVFVADGAPWVWDRLDWVERRVGIKAGRAVRVLDWCHAVHNMSQALGAVQVPEEERQRLFKQLRHWLKRGWCGLVVRELERLAALHGWPEAMQQPVGYLSKHAAAGHLAYGRFKRKGLPQGSGAIESAVRRVINLRLKGAGLMWEEKNAEAALILRAAAVTQRWEETLVRVREEMGKDRQLDWEWQGPDMLEELKDKKKIKPPTPQQSSP